MFQDVKVAAISFKPKKFDVAVNADQLETSFRTAAAGGAQLALGPEGVLDGYVVNEIIAGDEPAERMHEAAISLRSPVMGRFKALARELEMCLAFGLAERIGKDIFNCAVFIDHKGRIRGKYHKMQLAEGYHPSWWFNRLGEKSRAFDTPFGRCGFLICNDRWNEDIARIPVLDGAQYLLIPSFGSCAREQDQAVLSRARENGVPIVEANVGVTLIVNKGEISTVSRKKKTITLGTISIPAAAISKNRDHHERNFIRWRSEEMPRRYRQRMKAAKETKTNGKNPVKKVSHDRKGAIVKGP